MSPSRKASAKKPAPKESTKPKPTKVAERETKALRAEGQIKPISTAKATASTANTDRRIVTHKGSAAEAASAKMQLLRHAQGIAGPSAGFVSNRTASGNSFGSLKCYVADWSDADSDEVTSRLAISNPRHIQPAVGKVEHKIDLALRSLSEVKVATKVHFCLFRCIHIPSPRDSGRVSIIQPESLSSFVIRPNHMLLVSNHNKP